MNEKIESNNGESIVDSLMNLVTLPTSESIATDSFSYQSNQAVSSSISKLIKIQRMFSVFIQSSWKLLTHHYSIISWRNVRKVWHEIFKCTFSQ